MAKLLLHEIPLSVFLPSGALLISMVFLPSCNGRSSEQTRRASGLSEDRGIEFVQIGTVRSSYTPETGAPQQGGHAPDTESRIVVDGQYETALQDLDSFSHIIVLYAFDKSSAWSPLVRTPWEEKLHGLFATRSPNRPNPIGMTVVRLLRREGTVLYVSGLDAFDKSPVLDLKPYLPGVDCIEDATDGWMEALDRRPGSVAD
jgi:tRNA-Thr(GGU) m(6)t(6)A37 methyltransferase TsaA